MRTGPPRRVLKRVVGARGDDNRGHPVPRPRPRVEGRTSARRGRGFALAHAREDEN
jgi:hypothetical protein